MNRVTEIPTSKESIDETIRTLHLGATEKANAGDMDGAVDLLQRSNKLFSKTATIYPVEARLKLPLYLQKAGKFDDAIKELGSINDILDEEYEKKFPHLTKEERMALLFHDKSTINDKARLIHERERKFKDALYFRILSIAFSAVACNLQGLAESVEIIQGTWRKKLDPLLKKCKAQDVGDVLVRQCESFTEICTSDGLPTFSRDIHEFIAHKIQDI